MSDKAQLILGGELQHHTGRETTATAGQSCLDGTPLYRHCITPRVARVDRVGKGRYRIIRSDGSSRWGDEVDAITWRQALRQWESDELTREQERADYWCQQADARIDADALRVLKRALKNGGYTEICWSSSGGVVEVDGLGGVIIGDIFRAGGILGYEVRCHTVSNRRYMIFGRDASDVGKIKSAIGEADLGT